PASPPPPGPRATSPPQTPRVHRRRAGLAEPRRGADDADMIPSPAPPPSPPPLSLPASPAARVLALLVLLLPVVVMPSAAARAGGGGGRAVAGGPVRSGGAGAGRGVVSVVHADGLIAPYEPVDGGVSAGDPVGAGQVLGTLEGSSPASHCAGRDCLHLGAGRGELYVDPLLLLGGRGPSVLLPWTGGASGGGAGAIGQGSSPGAEIGRGACREGRDLMVLA